MFILFIAAKTGGVITYLIMWYFFAIVNAYQNEKIESVNTDKKYKVA